MHVLFLRCQNLRNILQKINNRKVGLLILFSRVLEKSEIMENNFLKSWEMLIRAKINPVNSGWLREIYFFSGNLLKWQDVSENGICEVHIYKRRRIQVMGVWNSSKQTEHDIIPVFLLLSLRMEQQQW